MDVVACKSKVHKVDRRVVATNKTLPPSCVWGESRGQGKGEDQGGGGKGQGGDGKG